MVNDLAEVVAAGDLVFEFPEDFADLVFDGVRAGGAGFELLEVGEEAAIYKLAEVVTRKGVVVVDSAGLP